MLDVSMGSRNGGEHGEEEGVSGEHGDQTLQEVGLCTCSYVPPLHLWTYW